MARSRVAVTMMERKRVLASIGQSKRFNPIRHFISRLLFSHFWTGHSEVTPLGVDTVILESVTLMAPWKALMQSVVSLT